MISVFVHSPVLESPLGLDDQTISVLLHSRALENRIGAQDTQMLKASIPRLIIDELPAVDSTAMSTAKDIHFASDTLHPFVNTMVWLQYTTHHR